MIKFESPVVRLFLFVFLLCSSLSYAQNDCSLDLCNEVDCGDGFVTYSPSGSNVFCEGNTVTLENTSSTLDYDEFYIDWGDGTIDTVYDYSSVSHTYDYEGIDRCAEGPSFNQVFCYVGLKSCAAGISCNWASGLVSVNLLPVAQFENPQQACVDQNVTFLNTSCNGSTYLWNFGDGTTSTDSIGNHAYAAEGFYNVSLTTFNECGEETQTEDIEVIGLPEANAEYVLDPVSGCVDVVVTFDNTVPDYENYSSALWEILPLTGWEFVDTSSATSWDNEIEFSLPGTYDVLLSVTNVCGVDTWLDSIFIFEAPTVNLDFMGNYCETATINFGDYVTYTGTIDTYSWVVTFPDGTIQIYTEDMPSTPVFSMGGNYDVEITVTSTACGTMIDNSSFFIELPGVADLSAVPNITCTGENAFPLIASPPGGIWTSIPVGPVSGGTFDPALAIAGTTYTLDYSPQGDCVNGSSTTITVFETPTINLPTVTAQCDSYIFTPSNNFVTGDYDDITWTYIIAGQAPVSSTTLPAPIDFNQAGNNLFFVTLDGPCGPMADTTFIEIQTLDAISINLPSVPFCTTSPPEILATSQAGGTWTASIPGAISPEGLFDSSVGPAAVTVTYTYSEGVCTEQVSETIIILQSATVTVETGLSLCEDHGSYTLQANPTGGIWSDANGLISADGTFSTTTTVPGVYSFSYAFTDINDCSILETAEVTIESLPTIEMDAFLLFCETNVNQSIPDALTVLNLSPATGTVTWSGSGIVDPVNGLFNTNAAGGEGLYTIYANYMLVDCEITDSLQIQVVLQTLADAGPDVSVCMTEGTQQLIGMPAGGTWSEIGGLGTGLNPATGVLDLALAGGGVHTYQYIISSGTSCEQVDQVAVEIIDLTSVNAGVDVNVCESETIFTLSGFSPPGGIWTGTGIIDSLLGTVDVSTLALGPHQFTYTIEDNSIVCVAEDVMTLFVRPLPVSAFLIDGDTCIGSLISFDNIAQDSMTYFWNFGNGLTSTDVDASTSYATAGDFTITLTATSFYGCVHTTSQEIHISEPPPLVEFEMDVDEGCAPLAVTFTNISQGEDVSFFWDFGNGETSTVSDPGTIVFPQGNTDTVYYVTLSVANACGNSSFVDSVLVNPQPVSVFGTDFNSYCSGETVYLANASYGNPDEYYFDYGNGMVSFDFNPIAPVYFTDTLPSVITITLITENSCGLDTLTQEITINPTNVSAFFNTDAVELCVGDTVNFTSFATPNADLVWEFGDGNTSSVMNPSHVYQDSGTYEIIQYAYGCGFDSTTVEVLVLPIPQVGFVSNEIVCLGDTLFFENTSDSLTVLSQWDFNDGTALDTLTNPFHIYDSSGMHTVHLEGISSLGCRNSFFAEVEVLPLPTASMTIPDSVCVDSEVTFTNTSTLMQPICHWSFGDGETSSECMPTHTYLSAGNYTVSLEIINNSGCRDTINQLIYVGQTPLADFTFTLDNICSPAVATFSNTSIDANAYFWDFGDGTSSTLQTPLPHVYSDGGTYQIELTANVDGICIHSVVKEIEVQQTPTALYSPMDTSGCSEFNLIFENLSIGDIINNTWDLDEGIFSNDPNPGGVYPDSGFYQTSLIVTTAFCQDTAYGVVEVFPAVQVSYNTVDILCNGASTGVIDIEPTNGTFPFEYLWSNASLFQDLNNIPAGDYQLTITDINNCPWTESITITEPPAIGYDLEGEGIVSCYEGSDGSLIVNANGGVPDYSYQWSTGNQTNEISNVPVGDYVMTITDANGCTFIESIYLGQNLPIEITPDVDHITCFDFNDGHIFVSDIVGGLGSYHTSLSGPNGYAEEGLTYTNLGPGVYTATIIDSLDCVVNYELEIYEPAEVFIDIEEDSFDIKMGETIELVTNYNASIPVFEWLPSLGLNCSDCPNPLARPLDDIVYEVFISDEFGCTDSDSVRFNVSADRIVFIPDGFTPNGDNNNDLFTIRSGDPGVKEILDFKIFDRWGEMLFQAKDFQPNDVEYGWDGTFRGEALNPGVFTYFAEIEFHDNVILTWEGDITLIR